MKKVLEKCKGSELAVVINRHDEKQEIKVGLSKNLDTLKSGLRKKDSGTMIKWLFRPRIYF